MVHGKQIVAVHLNGIFFGNAVADGLVGEVGTTELLVARCGESPRVVFDANDDRQLPHSGDIDSLVEVAL